MYVLIILAAVTTWLVIAVVIAAANNSEDAPSYTVTTEGTDTNSAEIVDGYENFVFPDRYDLEYESFSVHTRAEERKALVSNTYSYDTLRRAKRDLRHRDRNNGRKPRSAAYSHHKAHHKAKR